MKFHVWKASLRKIHHHLNFWCCLHFWGHIHFLGCFHFWICIDFWSRVIFVVVFIFEVVFIFRLFSFLMLFSFLNKSSFLKFFFIIIYIFPSEHANYKLVMQNCTWGREKVLINWLKNLNFNLGGKKGFNWSKGNYPSPSSEKNKH